MLQSANLAFKRNHGSLKSSKILKAAVILRSDVVGTNSVRPTHIIPIPLMLGDNEKIGGAEQVSRSDLVILNPELYQ